MASTRDGATEMLTSAARELLRAQGGFVAAVEAARERGLSGDEAREALEQAGVDFAGQLVAMDGEGK